MDGADRILATIDHAVLKPEADREQVVGACELAVHFGVAGVCAHPRWVTTAAAALRGTPVATGTVVGFPLGANTTEVKAFEANQATSRGADEVDMVMAICALRSGDYDQVRGDVEAVVQAARAGAGGEALVKVILEMCYLSEREKRIAAELAVEGGADFVKTSTGLGPSGATVEDVRLLRSLAPRHVGVKAAGGIRTLEQLRAMLKAGASRIGTSATADIAAELGLF
jgi:deoxyribose-phosphate aldolase